MATGVGLLLTSSTGKYQLTVGPGFRLVLHSISFCVLIILPISLVPHSRLLLLVMSMIVLVHVVSIIRMLIELYLYFEDLGYSHHILLDHLCVCRFRYQVLGSPVSKHSLLCITYSETLNYP